MTSSDDAVDLPERAPAAQARARRRRTRNVRRAQQRAAAAEEAAAAQPAAEATAWTAERHAQDALRLQECPCCLNMYAMDTQQGIAGGSMAWMAPENAPFAEACRRAQVRPFSMPAGRLAHNPQDALRCAVSGLLQRQARPTEITYGTQPDEGIFQTMVRVRALGLQVIGPERPRRAAAIAEAASTAVAALERRGWVRLQ
jgi:hypothetical protein